VRRVIDWVRPRGARIVALALVPIAYYCWLYLYYEPVGERWSPSWYQAWFVVFCLYAVAAALLLARPAWMSEALAKAALWAVIAIQAVFVVAAIALTLRWI
jgi:hypothetical protein